MAKLSMKVSEYYKSATASANSAEYPSSAFFPVVRCFLSFHSQHPLTARHGRVIYSSSRFTLKLQRNGACHART